MLDGTPTIAGKQGGDTNTFGIDQPSVPYFAGAISTILWRR